jgi:hypothetical protein
MEQHDKAVEHYRRYVALEPKGEDVSEVKKIISDYEAAQKKAGRGDDSRPAARRKKRRER